MYKFTKSFVFAIFLSGCAEPSDRLISDSNTKDIKEVETSQFYECQVYNWRCKPKKNLDGTAIMTTPGKRYFFKTGTKPLICKIQARGRSGELAMYNMWSGDKKIKGYVAQLCSHYGPGL